MTGYTFRDGEELFEQTDAFLNGAEAEENAGIVVKLVEEGLDSKELQRGHDKRDRSKDTFKDARGSVSISPIVTSSRQSAMVDLEELFGQRVRIVRAKLQENDEDEPLLEALNNAIRVGGRSAAAVGGRVEAFLSILDEPIVRQAGQEPVTIRQVVDFQPKHEQALQDSLKVFRGTRQAKDQKLSTRVKQTADKNKALADLDRWLAKWQNIARAVLEPEELLALGIPAPSTRKPRTRKTTKPAPTETEAPAAKPTPAATPTQAATGDPAAKPTPAMPDSPAAPPTTDGTAPATH